MHIVAIGDIGVRDDMIHIGDEAMFGALVDAVRSRGVDRITAISSNPAESARRYGIEAVRPLGFDTDRAGNRERARQVLAAARGNAALAADDPAWALIEVLRACDGVIVAGGGNLTSLWPHHVAERVTLGELADALGVPYSLTGQTIGPALDDEDRTAVGRLLGGARLVGVREQHSFDTAGALGVDAPLHLTIDDASLLVDDEPETSGYCLVSLANHVGDADRDSVMRAVAELLDGIGAHTGLEVVFLAHFGSLLAGDSRGDSRIHDLVIERMGSRATTVVTTDPVAAARLARNASFVVSSRYHPVVFAVPAGVPALAIPVDQYTGVKLRGALTNFGQDGILAVADLEAGHGPDVAAGLWGSRFTIREDARRRLSGARAETSRWWDRLVDSLR